MTRPDVPPPVRRPPTPVPPLPQYGRRPEPPHVDTAPAPVSPSRYEPVAPHGYDSREYAPAPGHGAGYGAAYEREYPDNGWNGAAPDRLHGHDDQRFDRFQSERYDKYYDRGADYDDGFPARTNRMAIWGLVLAFFFAPLGLVFSAIGLSQARQRRERGRGLAIAGLVISVVVLAFGALFAKLVVDEVADQLAAEDTVAEQPLEQPVDQSALGTAPAAPAPATVLDACTTMMPVLVSAEQQMATATTEDDAVRVVADMRAAVVWAGAAPDPTFQGHLQTLATDLQALIDATSTGVVPPGLVETLEQDSFMVGKDCGLNGWTP